MQGKPLYSRGVPAQVGSYVQQKIYQLSESNNASLTRATLARLRRGIGKPPGSLPDLWGEVFLGMGENLAGKGMQPSYAEWAIYLSITLFALHQQSKDIKDHPMHLPSQRLGHAVRKLVHSAEDETRVKRRFDQVVTADSPEEIAHHLRGVIQLLRAQDVPLDYASLASDLYLMQIPEARDGVRLRWGRDYYASTFAKPDHDQKDTQAEKTEGETQNEEE